MSYETRKREKESKHLRLFARNNGLVEKRFDSMEDLLTCCASLGKLELLFLVEFDNNMEYLEMLSLWMIGSLHYQWSYLQPAHNRLEDACL